MRSKRIFRTSLLLLLAVLVPLLSLPLAHAANPTIFSSTPTVCAGACSAVNANIGGPSQIIIIGQAPAQGACIAPPAVQFAVSDTFGNTYSGQQCILIGSGGGTSGVVFMEFAASTHATGTDAITVSCGPCAFTIYSVASFVAFGQSSTFAMLGASGSDTRSIAVLSGSLIIGAMVMDTSSVNCGTFTLTSSQTNQQTYPCQTVGGQGSTSGISTSQVATNAGTFVDSVTWACGGCAGNQGIGRFIQELQGSQAGSIVTVTQCFGNCGNPAVTLANTNSTHSINFNQSLTLFYPFVSSLNGFFVNASVNMAKTYSNGEIVYLGLYVAASCPLGSTPFTANCPGSLITSGSFANPVKGKVTLTVNNGVTLTNGENAAVAVSCLFGPCDINDTNTNVAISQTNGVLPSVIAQSASLASCACKTGLWTYITGNIVTNTPTGTPTGGICPGLDCILTNIVNSFCTTITASCQTASSIFWIIILTIMTLGVLLGIFSYWLPNLNLSTRGLGEFAILIFIGWFAAFGALNLLLPWFVIFAFFVVAWLFLGKARGSGPI